MNDTELLEKLSDFDPETLRRAAELIEERGWPKEITFYSHTTKDDNWETSREYGLDEEAQRNFSYTGYEITFTCDLLKDGTVMAKEVNGVPLIEPVKI